MTSTGPPSPLQYHCPRCNALLTASAESAGTRQPCPQCQQMIKVPGGVGAAAESLETSGGKLGGGSGQVTAGIANVAFLCPTCSTRLYAAKNQIGSHIVCPDCLESVAVPGQLPSPSQPVRSTSADSQKPPEVTDDDLYDDLDHDLDDDPGVELRLVDEPGDKTAEQPATASTDDEDEYKLAAPIELPPSVFIKDAERAVDKAVKEAEEAREEGRFGGRKPRGKSKDDEERVPWQVESEAPSEPTPPPLPPPPPAEKTFAVTCEVCDTRIDATEEEIGTTRTCPDCGTAVVIVRSTARPKKKYQSPPAGSDEGSDFELSEPVERAVFKKLESAHAAESDPVGEAPVARPHVVRDDTLDRAEEDEERRRRETPVMPDNPLLTGVLTFWQKLSTVASVLAVALAIGVELVIVVNAVRLRASESPVDQLFSLALFVVATIAMVVMGSFVSMVNLLILQESSNGQDDFESFPGLNFLDWIAEALFIGAAAIYSISPGMVILWLACAGVPAWVGMSAMLVCGFAFFPIVLMSMLEDSSLATPLSRPVLRSLKEKPVPWAIFYFETAVLASAAGVFGMLATADNQFWLLLVGLVWAACLAMYFRLLGRLVWWCAEYEEVDDD